MKIKKWLILVTIFTLALSTAGAITAFALTSNDEGADDGEIIAGDINQGIPTYEEWLSEYEGAEGPVTSIDDIDPDECNLVHNINACSPEELEALSGATLTDGEPASIGICSPELPDCTDYLVIPQGEDGELEHESEVGDNPKPHFVDGEPGYVVQPLEEAVREDCYLAGGTVYVTSDGELGCEVVHDSEDNEDELVTSSQLPAIESEPAPATPST